MTTMTKPTLSEALTGELMQEAAATRRVLERVPDDKLSWAPDPKSMTLGTLALHVAMIPGALADFLSELDREAPTFSPPEATSRGQVLEALESSVAGARAKLAAWDDGDLMAEWKMSRGSDILIATPRIQMVRSVMLNHWYHHRGQLTVYLRLLGVPVPAIYGPSADESPFGPR